MLGIHYVVQIHYTDCLIVASECNLDRQALTPTNNFKLQSENCLYASTLFPKRKGPNSIKAKYREWRMVLSNKNPTLHLFFLKALQKQLHMKKKTCYNNDKETFKQVKLVFTYAKCSLKSLNKALERTVPKRFSYTKKTIHTNSFSFLKH